MTENINAGQANDAAVTGQEPAAPVNAPTEPVGSDWLSGADDDTTAFVAGKGWKDAASIAKSYRNIERFAKGAKDVIGLPDFDNKDQSNEFYNKLGRPESSDGYEFKETENSGPMLDWFKQAAHNAGLSQKQANDIFKGHSEVEAAQQQAKSKQSEQTFIEEVDGLRKEFGAGFDNQVEIAKRAWANEGLDSDAVKYLEQQIGVEAAVHIGLSLAKGKTEDSFVGSEGNPTGFGAMTPAQARHQIAELKMDKTFMDAYLNQKGDVHTNAMSKMRRLQDFAAMGDNS